MSEEPGYTPPDLMLVGDDHVKAYLESDGEVGYEWNGATCLVLTVKGRKTGEDRVYALIFDVDDTGDEPRYVVVASMGGAPVHPQWYRNLSANPDVTVQIKGDRFAARARTAEGARARASVGAHEPQLAQLRRLCHPYRPPDSGRGPRTGVAGSEPGKGRDDIAIGRNQGRRSHHLGVRALRGRPAVALGRRCRQGRESHRPRPVPPARRHPGARRGEPVLQELQPGQAVDRHRPRSARRPRHPSTASSPTPTCS